MFRNTAFFCLQLILLVLLAATAYATDLEDSVSAYNTAAAGLQSLWDTYEDDHDDAFADYQSMMDNFYYYLEERGF
jgi:hypothetical protein